MTPTTKPAGSHSPTPWAHGWGDGITGPEAAAALEWGNKYPIRCASPFGGDKRLVAAIPVFAGHDHEADAALIVQAVNSHAELVEALRDTNGWLCRTDREGTAHQQRLALLLAKHGG